MYLCTFAVAKEVSPEASVNLSTSLLLPSENLSKDGLVTGQRGRVHVAMAICSMAGPLARPIGSEGPKLELLSIPFIPYT